MHRTEIKKGLERDFYEVEYLCRNCGHRFSWQYVKGLEAPERVMCPECKTNNTKKVFSK